MSDKIEKLIKLKKERNAVILAHFYQDNDIQDAADFTGDSLALAQKAQQIDADIILFCGVHFMAETAKILNPNKIVLVPDMEAGCSLANSAPKDRFKRWIDDNPGHAVISYINCSADVKSMCDVICTSSNADKIVNSFPKDMPILFAPDKYLGSYLNKKLNRNMKLWDGSCQVHEIFSEQEVINLMNQYPDSYILAHPECPENILAYADFVGSTTGIIKEGTSRPEKDIIILTEPGVIHQMKKIAPDKNYIPVASLAGCACNLCPYMKLNTIDKMISALENLEPQIILDDEVRIRAEKPLLRMLELSK